MNILITSAGTRNKVVQYFKKEFKRIGNVIATDMSDLAPAIYEADKYYLVPRISDSNYIDKLLDICKKENIDCIFALIDPELSLISKYKERFLEIGVTPLISDYDAVELAFDKFKMYSGKFGLWRGIALFSSSSSSIIELPHPIFWIIKISC